jgi:hypothetical protein
VDDGPGRRGAVTLPGMSEVLLWSELVARAGTPWAARRLLADGRVRRVLVGAYVDADVPDSPAVRAAAARRVLPAGVALSGRSAAWALGLDVGPRDGSLEVTTARGLHLLARPGLRPCSAALPDSDLVDLPGGLLAVSAARAFADVARREPLVEAVAFGDALLRSGAATHDAVRAAVTRSRGLRGVVGARRAVLLLEPRAESAGESRLRVRLLLAGLRPPEVQVDLYDGLGRHLGRVDMLLDDVALEYDGRATHEDPGAFVRDRRRQNALVEHGLELRRFSAADVRPGGEAALRGTVLRAVGLAAARPAPVVVRGPDTLRPPWLEPLPVRGAPRRRAAA